MEELIRIFPLHLRTGMQKIWEQYPDIEEIRIRIQQPMIFAEKGMEYCLVLNNGMVTTKLEEGYVITSRDLAEMMAYMSQYSLYAFEEEVRAGYLTMQGGHRIGLAGKTVCQNKEVKTIRQISYLNIRVAKEKQGCADLILPWIRWKDTIYNTLILSPPGVGKTTLLREVIRKLSVGETGRPGLRIGVVDERSEVAACYMGQPKHNLGPRTDVMDGCPKSVGIFLLLRSMSPQVIAVDELGGQAELEQLEYGLHCGCSFLGTVHGASPQDLLKKPYLKHWITSGVFQRFVSLYKLSDGNRKFQIYDERLEEIC